MIEFENVNIEYFYIQELNKEYIRIISTNEDPTEKGYLIWKNQEISPSNISRWIFCDIGFYENSYFSIIFPSTYQISTLQNNQTPVLDPNQFSNQIIIEVSTHKIDIFEMFNNNNIQFIQSINYVQQTENYLRFGFYNNKIYFSDNFNSGTPLQGNFIEINLMNDYTDYIKQFAIATFSDEIRRPAYIKINLVIFTLP